MKRIAYIIWGMVSFCTIFPMKAQETHSIKLGFSLGIDRVDGSLKKELPRVREYSYYPYDDYFHCGFSSKEEWITIKHAGIDAEYFMYNNRIGISGGLQFSQCSSKFGTNGNYFFWELGQEGLTTDYLIIQNIKQDLYCLGIPLGFRFFVAKRNKPFRFYTKIGLDMNYRIGTDTKITFLNKEMDKYAKTVEKQLGVPSPFWAYAYPAFGFNIGKFKAGSKRPCFNLEFRLPGFMLNSNASLFVKPEAGLGFQVAIQIPFGNNIPAGSK